MNTSLRHLRVDTERDDRITVWIDVEGRPLNVLFEDVFDELLIALESIRNLRATLPVLFRSAKRKGFVVGADLRRILAIETDSEIQAFLLKGQKVFELLEQFQQDTIALIQGPCLGGGLEFAMACRWRFACDDPQTQIGMPEANIGLMPGWGGTQRLIELVGLEDGLPMLLGGNAIDAKRALDIGLVDALVDVSNLESSLSERIHGLERGQKQTQVREIVRGHGGGVGPLTRSTTEEFGAGPLTRSTTEDFGAGPLTRSTTGSASQVAIMKAVAMGIEESRDSGFRAERELFWGLLSDPAVREKLQSFGGKKS